MFIDTFLSENAILIIESLSCLVAFLICFVLAALFMNIRIDGKNY